MLTYGDTESTMDRSGLAPRKPRPPRFGAPAPRAADPGGAPDGFGRDPYHTDGLGMPGAVPNSRGEGMSAVGGYIGSTAGGMQRPVLKFPTDTFSGGGPSSRGAGMTAGGGYQGAAPAANGAAPGGYQSPYASMSTFGPTQDLRGTTIAPTESGSLQGISAALGAARSAYTGGGMPAWQGVAGGSYAPGADTTGIRSAYTQAMQALANGPDRGQIASGYMSLLNQQNDEANARDMRVIGQNASKFGRIGSGITTTNLGDLGERQAISRDRAGKELSLDAASQAMQDKLNVVGALGGGFSTLGGADRADAGVQQSLRNENRGERDAANSYAQNLWNNRRTQYGDLLTEQGNQRGYESGLRSELRGERGYQNDMENQAYGRRIGETALSDQLTGNAFQRAMQLITAGYGSGMDLSQILQSVGNQQGAAAQGGMGDIATIIASLIGNRRAA